MKNTCNDFSFLEANEFTEMLVVCSNNRPQLLKNHVILKDFIWLDTLFCKTNPIQGRVGDNFAFFCLVFCLVYQCPIAKVDCQRQLDMKSELPLIMLELDYY